MTKEASVTIQGLNLGKMTKQGGGCVEIQFTSGGKVTGTLKVSRTKIEWVPSKKEKGFQITPRRLEELLIKESKKKKRSKIRKK
jgi:hypothetical protein